MEALVARINALPLLVALMWVGALAMLVPASYAWAIRDFADMRAFAYSGGLFLALCVLMSIVTNNKAPVWQGRNRLFHLFGAYTLLPAMLAVPVVISVGDTTFTNAYAEMVSCLTTTGAAFYDDPERLSAAVHLWRGLVAWLGGFFILVAAVAILAPLNLGGFDVLSGSSAGVTSASGDRFYSLDGGQRFLRYTFKLFPIYAGLTAVLWLLFTIETRAPMINLVHAMSILSTSGISPIAGGIGQAGGVTAEAMAMFFMIFALTRLPFNTETGQRSPRNFWSDPELRLGLLLVYLVSLLLFSRHWIGAFEVDRVDNLQAALSALWGGFFTVLSFLSTTGFESVHWEKAREWSGLATPGIVLMGMALIGGGVATTAGGVKLLRVYALYVHGRREMNRLVHPSSVGGAGSFARRLRREGAYLAWVFFMLFALSLAVVVLALTFNGLSLEEAMTLSVASLSTTGPLAQIALAEPVQYGLLSQSSKFILCGAMILGRMETLVIIALFNPDFWRK